MSKKETFLKIESSNLELYIISLSIFNKMISFMIIQSIDAIFKSFRIRKL